MAVESRPRHHLALLWLAGSSLRITLLAVPPVLALIHRDLRLDEKGVATLTGLPVLLLAAVAVPGSLLISTIGARRALLAGLWAVAAGGMARGIGPSVVALFASTFVMGAGVAVMQPAMPALVREWFPAQVGPATAIYTNGLLSGEILAAWLTLPILLPLLGQSWELALAFWSLPVILAAILLPTLTRHAPPEHAAPLPPWWPDWADGRTWRLSLILGGASTLYFGTNAFLPDYLRVTGREDLTTAALAALNGCQLLANVLIATSPRRFVGRSAPFLLSGWLALLGVLGCAALPGAGVVVGAGVIGFCTAFVLVLALALPSLLAEPADVHRLSAAMFTISYALAFVGPIIGGAIWDATARPATAFLPAAAAGLVVSTVPIGLRLPGDRAR